MDSIGIISVVGTLATLAGLGYTIRQVRKTKSSVEAAREAIQSTETKILGKSLIADASTVLRYIEVVQTLIRNDELLAAQIRLTDLKSQLGRLEHMVVEDKSAVQRIQRESDMLEGMDFELFRSINQDKNSELDKSSFYKKLSSLSLFLNKLIGKEQYSIEKEGK